MKTLLSLLMFTLLAQGSYAQDQTKPPQTAKTTPKIIKASSGAPTTAQHRPRHVTPYPPGGQAYFQRPARWEYCIRTRICESEIGVVFQFTCQVAVQQQRSSQGLSQWLQVEKASRIDEVNALNTLASLSWELTSTQKRKGASTSAFYFKRRFKTAFRLASKKGIYNVFVHPT